MHAAGCEQQLPAARLVRLPLSLNHVKPLTGSLTSVHSLQHECVYKLNI